MKNVAEESSGESEKTYTLSSSDNNEIESVDTEKDYSEKVDENMKISEEIVEDIV